MSPTQQNESTVSTPPSSTTLAPPKCPQCLKKESFCVCSEIKPLANKLEVVILQHPQEPDKNLGTARVAHLMLKNSQLRIGLSWPNLTKALGLPKDSKVLAKDWIVLHLGSGMKPAMPKEPGIYFVNKKGERLFKPNSIKGVIILDGSWSQGKTLWWRNAWLLKIHRAMLVPKAPSLYGKLRKEPRKECLSTIEAIAETLSFLGESPQIEKEMKRVFATLLTRAKK